MWTKDFLKGVLERAVSTFMQTLLAVLTLDGVDWLNVNWGDTLGAAGFAALLSVIKSFIAGGVTGTASMTKAEVPAGQAVEGYEPKHSRTVYSSDQKAEAAGYDPYPGAGPGGGG
jgi:predicted phage tail protein